MSEMSSNKRIKVDDNYRRDSFADRVFDDLSEVILQFLPLKDKLRYECVSKQFQRTIFKKQTVLNFNYFIKTEEELNYFEKFVKKLSNINKIVIVTDIDIHGYNERVIQMFKKYCHQLIHLDLDEVDDYKIDGLNRLQISDFLDIFGPQLQTLKLHDFTHNSWQTIIDIKELDLNAFTPLLSQIKFNRLQSLRFDYIRDKDVDQLKTFLELNANNIKRLSLGTYSLEAEETHLKTILKTITEMKKLIDLRIDSKFGINDKRFATLWKEISLKCLNLKRLDISFDLHSEEMESIDKLLSPLKQFKELKSLRIYFVVNDEEQQNMKTISFISFKGFQELTHLTIGTNLYPSLVDIIFTDIDINLPKLQSLLISDTFAANEETVDILGRLSSLETIVLNITNEEFVSKIKTKLQNNCKRIKTIDISFSRMIFQNIAL